MRQPLGIRRLDASKEGHAGRICASGLSRISGIDAVAVALPDVDRRIHNRWKVRVYARQPIFDRDSRTSLCGFLPNQLGVEIEGAFWNARRKLAGRYRGTGSRHNPWGSKRLRNEGDQRGPTD